MKKSLVRSTALSIFLFSAALFLDGCGSQPASSDSQVPPVSSAVQSAVTQAASVSSVYGNTNGNLMNRGISVQLDGWIYYGEDGITKMSADGSQTVKINSDCYAEYLNAENGWLYFVNVKDKSLYKIRTDGSDKTLLCSGNITDAHVVDDWIYYDKTASGIDMPFKMHTDGTGATGMPFGYCSFADGWVYYVDSSKTLCKYSMNGKDVVPVGNDRVDNGPDVSGGWAYYHADSDDLLYKIKTDGTGLQKLSSDKVAVFTVDGDQVYYTPNDDFRIYKMNTDGTNRIRLTDNTAFAIDVVGDWVFYESTGDSCMNLYKMRTDGTEQQLLEQY